MMQDEIHSEEHEREPVIATLASAPRDEGWLVVESRPKQIIAANYAALPFPKVGTMQELTFDLGITAVGGDALLTGVVFRAYHEHQLLFEQRWNRAALLGQSGEAELTIAQGMGLALRSIHFMLHAHLPVHFIDVVAMARKEGAGEAGETVQARTQIPVAYHEQKTDLHFPLRGAWWAIQGNDWSDLHKQEVFSQAYAMDFVKLGHDNQFFRGRGETLEEHYSWDEPVYATAGGKIAHVAWDMPDMQPGQLPDPRMFRGDPRRILGNVVVISHANGEFTFYGHLQQAGVHVNEGQIVRRGALLGRVGNSGQSPGPNLHLQLMEGPNLFIDRGLPMRMSHFGAGGQFFEQLTFIPTRMIVHGSVIGPADAPSSRENGGEERQE